MMYVHPRPQEHQLLPSDVFGKRKSCKTKFALSPREVSLKEGTLPTLPADLVKKVGDYLHGKREADFITSENYREVLRAVKVVDLDLDRCPRSRAEHVHSTYPLRELCLRASRGAMPSYEAYTKSIQRKYYEDPFSPEAMEYAADINHYVPERVAELAHAALNFSIDAMGMSHRLENTTPEIFLLRGCSGTGKTFVSKRHPALFKGLDDHSEMSGTCAVDNFKLAIREWKPINNLQIHREGCSFGKPLITELERAKGLTVVRDETFASAYQMEMAVVQARALKKPLRIVDLDAPLMVSCLRILQRDIRSEPALPLTPIATIYEGIKSEREDVVRLIACAPEVASYELWVTDPSGKIGLAARKGDKGFEILDKNLFAFSIDKKTIDKEIREVQRTIITRDLLLKYQSLGVQPDKLEPYMGMTIEAALSAHSSGVPQV